MLYHKRRYVQHGRGVGSIFRSLLSTVLPALKTLGKEIITSPITKKALHTIKKKALNAGLKIAKDTLHGENVGQSITKKLREILDTNKSTAKVSKSKSKKKTKNKQKIKNKTAVIGGKRKASNIHQSNKRSRWSDIYEEFSE